MQWPERSTITVTPTNPTWKHTAEYALQSKKISCSSGWLTRTKFFSGSRSNSRTIARSYIPVFGVQMATLTIYDLTTWLAWHWLRLCVCVCVWGGGGGGVRFKRENLDLTHTVTAAESGLLKRNCSLDAAAIYQAFVTVSTSIATPDTGTLILYFRSPSVHPFTWTWHFVLGFVFAVCVCGGGGGGGEGWAVISMNPSSSLAVVYVKKARQCSLLNPYFMIVFLCL